MLSELGLLLPAIGFGSPGSQAFGPRLGLNTIGCLWAFGFGVEPHHRLSRASSFQTAGCTGCPCGTSQLPSPCEPIPPKKNLFLAICILLVLFLWRALTNRDALNFHITPLNLFCQIQTEVSMLFQPLLHIENVLWCLVILHYFSMYLVRILMYINR